MDTKIMNGYFDHTKYNTLAVPPFVIGADFSGTVVDVGAKSKYRKGDEVYGDFLATDDAGCTGGSLAEHVVIYDKNLFTKPEKVDHKSAAALGTAGSLAMKAIEYANIKDGERVLVLGASNDVGSLALQLLKAVNTQSGLFTGYANNLHVTAVIDDYSDGNKKKDKDGLCAGGKLAKSQGADQIIEKHENWSGKGSRSLDSSARALKCGDTSWHGDVILDFTNAPGSNNWEHAVFAFENGNTKGGRFVTTSGDSSEGGEDEKKVGFFKKLFATVKKNAAHEGISFIPVQHKPGNHRFLEELKTLVDGGQLIPHIGKHFPFSKVIEAYEHLESGKTPGKVVVNVKGKKK